MSADFNSEAGPLIQSSIKYLNEDTNPGSALKMQPVMHPMKRAQL